MIQCGTSCISFSSSIDSDSGWLFNYFWRSFNTSDGGNGELPSMVNFAGGVLAKWLGSL